MGTLDNYKKDRNFSKDLLRANTAKYFFFVSLSIIAATGNMGVIYIINNTLKELFSNVQPGTSNVQPGSGKYIYLFPLALTVYFISRWMVSKNIIGFTQNMLRKIRMEILQMVLQSSYYPLIKNKARIHLAMTRDAGNIVQASVSIVDVVTNVIIVLICFIYMGMLSWKLLLCILGIMVFTIIIYAYSEKKGNRFFNEAMTHDDKFVKYLNEILDGFKEIVIERRKGTAIEQKYIVASIDSSAAFNKKALVTFLNNRVIGQMGFYIFIGLIMLYLGRSLGISNTTLVSFIFLVLYVFGPIETVVILIPGLSQAKSSLKRLSALKNDLIESELEHFNRFKPAEPVAFRTLRLQNIFYRYKGEGTLAKESFSVGPLDFQLEAGKTVFIYGGNGSGKTTFINLLVGLFPPDMGEIHINDTRITASQPYGYRSLFAPVFSDFHLFDECYSLDLVDLASVNGYIELFELENKVKFSNNKFTTIELSTGQRKRLALICAILECKPILVLDEFGADQDPHFRKKFYTEILTYLKEQGFTVIAITHDDNYYGYCDVLYKMDEGKIEWIGTYDQTTTLLA